MKQLAALVLALMLGLSMTACGSPAPTDQEAKDLFTQGVLVISDLAYEDPRQVVWAALEGVEYLQGRQEVRGVDYEETNQPFQALADYYGQYFTAEALEWILSTKFADVDGVLYVSQAGGESGWGIEEVTVRRTGRDGGRYQYEATFQTATMSQRYPNAGQFALEQTQQGWRIAEIDYKPQLLEYP